MELLFFILLIVFLVWLLMSVGATSNHKKIELINACIQKSLIKYDLDTNYYCLHIPIRIYNLQKGYNSELYQVEFDLIYFELNKGKFSTGDTKISYKLDELYEIFQSGLRGNKSSIYVNWIARKLIIFPQQNQRMDNINRLKYLYKELKSVEYDIDKLNKEVAKVESLMNTIQSSELYQYQVKTYQRGLNLLKQSQTKATRVRDEYLKFLKEYTLSFYLEDVESTVFQVESKEIAWEAKYKSFKEDYNLLQSMIEEYNKLRVESWS